MCRPQQVSSPRFWAMSSMHIRSWAVWVFASLAVMSACAMGNRAIILNAIDRRDVPRALVAYNRMAAREGPDLDLLADIAAVVLEKEAQSEDRARANLAFTQLGFVGSLATPVLERISARTSEPARSRALSILAQRGSGAARRQLEEELETANDEVLGWAVAGIDPEDHCASLVRFVAHTHESVRRAAARGLGECTSHEGSFDALREVSRRDPSSMVRAAAANALASWGATVIDVLRDRMSDSDPSVRLAVVGAIARADRESARRLLSPLLSSEPSAAGVEAARFLASGPDDSDSTLQGRAYLRNALETAGPDVRAQAAVALLSLSDTASLRGALAARLQAESHESVKLALAILLTRQPETQDAARTALEVLLEGQPAIRLQAAAALADLGVARGKETLIELTTSSTVYLRRAAMRAVAYEGRDPSRARPGLRDEDPTVRIYAAGGILASVGRL